MPPLRGIIPPVPTPFDAEGNLALALLTKMLQRLLPETDGILLLGSTGEAPFLTEDERREVLKAAREVVPKDKLLLLGTAAESLNVVLARNDEAAAGGADAVLVLPPSYFGNAMTSAALERYFVAVADTSPLPVYLYNFPGVSHLSLAAELISVLGAHPNIRGMKDSSGNLSALADIVRLAPEGFEIATGSASTFLAALSLGVSCGVLGLANIAPQRYREIMTRFAAGDVSGARELHLRLLPLSRVVGPGFGVAGIKRAMKLLGNDAGEVRLPLTPFADDDALKGVLAGLDLL